MSQYVHLNEMEGRKCIKHVNCAHNIMTVKTNISQWKDLFSAVQQGSILGPLVFNIYIKDLFSLLSDIDVCKFVDCTTALLVEVWKTF